MSAAFDLSEFPLVRIHWGKELTIADIDACYDQLIALQQKCVADGSRFVVVSWGADSISSKLRKHIADEAERRVTPKLQRASIATFVVVESPIMRGILTELKWMSPKMAIIHPVATLEEGVREARRVLAEHGITRVAS